MHAFVIYYTAYATGPAASYCVDRTTGKTSVLPANTPNVMWTKKPSSNGGRCNLQGVLRITPPRWARSVSFHMAFEKSTSYSLNIGDSSTNNGWGKIINFKWRKVMHMCSVAPDVFYYWRGRRWFLWAHWRGRDSIYLTYTMWGRTPGHHVLTRNELTWKMVYVNFEWFDLSPFASQFFILWCKTHVRYFGVCMFNIVNCLPQKIE